MEITKLSNWKTRKLQAEADEISASVGLLVEKVNRGERLSADESRSLAEATDKLAAIKVETFDEERVAAHVDAVNAKLYGGGVTERNAPVKAEIRGVANEVLGKGQSVRSWFNAAARNGAIRHNGTDRDIEAYWQERFGFAKPTVESRALGGGTSSGAGAGAAIVPEEWSTNFIDLLRSNLVLSDVQIMPMNSVRFHYPVYAQDVSPAYVAENASVSLDGNPSFAPLIFDASGAYMDVTLVSRQIVDDYAAQGNLAGLLTSTITQNYARLVEKTMLFGNSSIASIQPGLAGESGLQHFAAEATLTDYNDLSKAAEKVRNANAEPTGIITNPSVFGTYSRLAASTYAKYWTPPQDVQAIWPPRVTTLMPATETAAAAAETGGALSSAFVGDFSRIILGVRIELQVDVLRERYADQGQIGLVSYLRFNSRVTHPETFVRVTDLTTT